MAVGLLPEIDNVIARWARRYQAAAPDAFSTAAKGTPTGSALPARLVDLVAERSRDCVAVLR